MLRLTQTLLALCLLPHASFGQRISAFVGYPFGWDMSAIPEGQSSGAQQLHPAMMFGVGYVMSDTVAPLAFHVSWEETHWKERFTYFSGNSPYVVYRHSGALDLRLRTIRLGMTYRIPIGERIILSPGLSVGYLVNAHARWDAAVLAFSIDSPSPSSPFGAWGSDADKEAYYHKDLNRVSPGLMFGTGYRIGQHWEAGANLLFTFYSVAPDGKDHKPKYFQFTVSRDIVNLGNKKG